MRFLRPGINPRRCSRQQSIGGCTALYPSCQPKCVVLSSVLMKLTADALQNGRIRESDLCRSTSAKVGSMWSGIHGSDHPTGWMLALSTRRGRNGTLACAGASALPRGRRRPPASAQPQAVPGQPSDPPLHAQSLRPGCTPDMARHVNEMSASSIGSARHRSARGLVGGNNRPSVHRRYTRAGAAGPATSPRSRR